MGSGQSRYFSNILKDEGDEPVSRESVQPPDDTAVKSGPAAPSAEAYTRGLNTLLSWLAPQQRPQQYDLAPGTWNAEQTFPTGKEMRLGAGSERYPCITYDDLMASADPLDEYGHLAQTMMVL